MSQRTVPPDNMALDQLVQAATALALMRVVLGASKGDFICIECGESAARIIDIDHVLPDCPVGKVFAAVRMCTDAAAVGLPRSTMTNDNPGVAKD